MTGVIFFCIYRKRSENSSGLVINLLCSPLESLNFDLKKKNICDGPVRTVVFSHWTEISISPWSPRLIDGRIRLSGSPFAVPTMVIVQYTLTDKPPSEHLFTGKELVFLKDKGVRLLHGTPPLCQGRLYFSTGRACSQPLHRLPWKSKTYAGKLQRQKEVSESAFLLLMASQGSMVPVRLVRYGGDILTGSFLLLIMLGDPATARRRWPSIPSRSL